MTPFFSIIIPTYNREATIKRAISSVINQTFTDWEIVLVDDGSTDNTKSIIESFHHPRIKYIYQSNSERSAARNKGIKNAVGRYICFLDSDDEFYPEYLFQLHNQLEANQFPVGLFKSIPSVKEISGEIAVCATTNDKSNPIETFLTTYSPVCAICVHAGILKEFKFDEDLKYAEDTNLWMRIFTKYPLYNFPIRSCIVHISENSSNSGIHRQYIESFAKTFSHEEIKNLVSKNIINNLFIKRLNWMRQESRIRKDIVGYIKTSVKLLMFKLGIISFT